MGLGNFFRFPFIKKEKVVLSKGDDEVLFIEDQAFYLLRLNKDDYYMLPSEGNRANLPSSGFYIQIGYDKFLPHKQDTPVTHSGTCLALPSLMSYSDARNNDRDRMIRAQILKEAPTETKELPKYIQENMAGRIVDFLKKLERENESSSRVLVPVLVSIVAVVFSSEVKDVFSSHKKEILMNNVTT